MTWFHTRLYRRKPVAKSSCKFACPCSTRIESLARLCGGARVTKGSSPPAAVEYEWIDTTFLEQREPLLQLCVIFSWQFSVQMCYRLPPPTMQSLASFMHRSTWLFLTDSDRMLELLHTRCTSGFWRLYFKYRYVLHIIGYIRIKWFSCKIFDVLTLDSVDNIGFYGISCGFIGIKNLYRSNEKSIVTIKLMPVFYNNFWN